MRKIPTLFPREFEGHRVVSISHDPTPGFEWVLAGEGVATEKIDGACCALVCGKFYKRYDAKRDKSGNVKAPPAGAIPCDDPDPVTGHWPHWVPVDRQNPDDRWFVAAIDNTPPSETMAQGTYEAIGPHFQGNPYNLQIDVLRRHGTVILDLPDRSFEGIREYLRTHSIEGIVFWKDSLPQCKIKRKDFGFQWPDK